MSEAGIYISSGRKWAVAALFSVVLFFALGALPAEARVYIDVTSPDERVPVAVPEFTGTLGSRIAGIIASDLRHTNLFTPLPTYLMPEGKAARAEEFDWITWVDTGAELVIKGSVRLDEKLTATLVVYDVLDGSRILYKEYEAARHLLRPMAHAMAGDVYERVTGLKSIFRTKLAMTVVEEGDDDEDEDRRRLYLMDWDGRRLQKLAVTADIMLSPHWSRDGERLLYSGMRGRGWGIYMLELSSGEERKVMGGDNVLIAGDFFPGDEEFAYASTARGSTDIYLHALGDDWNVRLTAGPGIEVSPAVSPDGSELAFVSDMGGTPQIYTMNKNGYNITRVTFEGQYNTSPAWSPGGDRLAFVGYDSESKGNQILLLHRESGEIKRLTDEGNNEEPSFSPDGRFIAFVSDRGGRKAVYIMRTDGGGQRRISPEGMIASGVRWSP